MVVVVGDEGTMELRLIVLDDGNSSLLRVVPTVEFIKFLDELGTLLIIVNFILIKEINEIVALLWGRKTEENDPLSFGK